jgi:hypothetical protein
MCVAHASCCISCPSLRPGRTNHPRTSIQHAHAPSYVNELGSVLVSDATPAVIAAGLPAPAEIMHAIAVVVIQLVVGHSDAPIHAVGDVSVGPRYHSVGLRLMPHIVSVEPPVVGPFTRAAMLSTGAA